jgi:hypothetical protein
VNSSKNHTPRSSAILLGPGSENQENRRRIKIQVSCIAYPEKGCREEEPH